MRTFRLIETALLAILVCVNFIACSNNDKVEDIDSKIEGTWYLLTSQGYAFYKYEDDSNEYHEVKWEEKYPDLEENKMVIVKLSEDTYLIKVYIDYDSSTQLWEDDPISFIAKREGDDITPIEPLKDYWDSFRIVSINQNLLVLEWFEKEDEVLDKNNSYSKNSYVKE